MTDVNLIVALAAGVLALLSPCSALLLPSFFAYAFSSPRSLLARTFFFYLGLAITLVPLGMGAASVSKLFYGHRAELIAIAGWAIIILGVMQVLGKGFAVPGASRLSTWVMGRDSDSPIATLFLGAVYGLAGFCSGPVLGAILTVAATEGNAFSGGLLLATYAFGMTVPLFLLALVWDRFQLGSRRWLRGRTVRLGPIATHTTSLISGLLFIVVGVVFLRYDGTAGLAGFLGDTTDLEYTLQERISEWTDAVPMWTLPLVIALIAGLVAWRRMRATPDEAGSDEPGDGRDETDGPAVEDSTRRTTAG